MRKLSILILTNLFIPSCQVSEDESRLFNSVLKNCDEVNINYFHNSDTLIDKVLDTSNIEILRTLITGSGKVIGDTCPPTGEIIFKQKGQTILSAYFSTKSTNEKSTCGYVIYSYDSKLYVHQISFKAGKLIEKLYLKKLKSLPVKISTDTLKTYLDTTIIPKISIPG